MAFNDPHLQVFTPSTVPSDNVPVLVCVAYIMTEWLMVNNGNLITSKLDYRRYFDFCLGLLFLWGHPLWRVWVLYYEDTQALCREGPCGKGVRFPFNSQPRTEAANNYRTEQGNKASLLKPSAKCSPSHTGDPEPEPLTSWPPIPDTSKLWDNKCLSF